MMRTIQKETSSTSRRMGLTIEDVEQVLRDPSQRVTVSRSMGRPLVFGMTETGTMILVVYEILESEPVTVIRPVTAYEPESV